MKKGISMSLAEAEAHQRRHGFRMTPQYAVIDGKIVEPKSKPRMNGTETRFSLILESMLRRDEIVEWRFEGISLAWGEDPKTGKPMWYTPDFYVVVEEHLDCEKVFKRQKLIEVKGAHIREKDLVRFKGCRSDWTDIDFEMHQWKGGTWQRIH